MKAYTQKEAAHSAVSALVTETLALASCHLDAPPADLVGDVARTDVPLSEMVDACLAVCEEWAPRPTEPVRTIHHLSCAGGTLFTKCIAAMPNVLVLNEVDPLSPLSSRHGGKPTFTPTDMVALLRQGDTTIPDDVLVRLFVHQIGFILEQQHTIGRTLVLRDHSNSMFLFGKDVPKRLTVREMLTEHFEVFSVVTLRDPVDSYLSMKHLNWHTHFSPSSFDEYCKRYLQFLNRHQGINVASFTALTENPVATMKEICRTLDLEFNGDFLNAFGVFKFSGDSGRTDSQKIGPRRRLKSTSLSEEMIARSKNYNSLLAEFAVRDN